MSASRNTTTSADLQRAAQAHGLTLIRRNVPGIEAVEVPAIVLVHYGDLQRMDVAYTSGHWLVALGVEGSLVRYHDPDWWGAQMAQGANRIAPIRVFNQAMQNCDLDGNTPGTTLQLVGARS